MIFVSQRDGRVDGEVPPLDVDPVELADDADIAAQHDDAANMGNRNIKWVKCKSQQSSVASKLNTKPVVVKKL